MNFEKSCGAVVFKKENDIYYFLLLKHKNGKHWSFPKGHVENNETEKETALREIKEESGLDVNLINGFREVTSYSPKENTIKDVIYFLGELSSKDNVYCQLCEIEDSKFLPFNEASNLITHNDDKSILEKAYNFLMKIK